MNSLVMPLDAVGSDATQGAESHGIRLRGQSLCPPIGCREANNGGKHVHSG